MRELLKSINNSKKDYPNWGDALWSFFLLLNANEIQCITRLVLAERRKNAKAEVASAKNSATSGLWMGIAIK